MPMKPMKQMPMKPKVLDLFAGCGGLSLGFAMAGYDIGAGVEFWAPAAESYRQNHPQTPLFEGDIREIKPILFKEYPQGTFAVVIGGPPCQGYSLAGNRNLNDPRGELYLDYFDVVKYFQPTLFVMENVKGLLSMKKLTNNLSPELQQEVQDNSDKLARYKDLRRYAAQRRLSPEEHQEFDTLKEAKGTLTKKIESCLVPLTDLIQEKITSIGYFAKVKVLNAVDYGAPQKRERVIFIGAKNKDLLEDIFPPLTHQSLPTDPGSRTLDTFMKGKKGPPSPSLSPSTQPWGTVRDAIDDLKDAPQDDARSHVFTKHSPIFIERIKAVHPGENLYANYSDAWYRLLPDEPARTVKENHGGVFLHYEKDRCLTPRELARLQTFPDEFLFRGSKSEILKQIGNAVPPILAHAIALKLRKILEIKPAMPTP